MSITLTTPSQINSVLGGSVLIDYDHVVFSPINIDRANNKLSASIRMTSSASPNMDVINGTLTVDAGTGQLVFLIQQLDMLRKMQLSAAQITAVIGIMSDAQDSLESGLITIGVIDGMQQTGT